MSTFNQTFLITIIMTKPILLCVTLLACVAGLSDATAQSGSNPSNVTVIQRSEGETLAKGYVDAFKLIPSKPVFLTYEHRGQELRDLSGIRDLKSTGATLIVTTERGTTIVIAAANVVSLTDERPPTASVPAAPPAP